ncbi:hypothetical protein GCM10023196_057230 [Actinoallomurus vinaceus]|uniref:Transposase n=1 Tax=Actinoallomurus vinaceus TaxID=1080074 RepID=A0ABP8UF80_9ACTN
MRSASQPVPSPAGGPARRFVSPFVVSGPPIAIEDLNFEQDKTREKHGRRKQFRNLISRFPTARLKARLVSMATGHGVAIVAVDPAYTTKWGAQHWQKPLTTSNRTITRHDAAGIAIGRRALGHPIRRRTTPPPAHQSDEQGHRTVQAPSGIPGREGPCPRFPDHAHDARPRTMRRTQATSTPTTVRGASEQEPTPAH